MEPRISLVMPVYNGGETFKRCLEAVLRCSPPADEVIVASDQSADGSDEAAAALGVRVIRTARNGGAAAARNEGVRHATGDVLMFVDADVEVAPDAVARVKRHFAEPGAADAVFGSYDDAPRDPHFVSSFRNLLHHHVHVTSAEESSSYWAGLGALRREAFEAAGGFDPRLRWLEDFDLGRRLKAAGRRIRLLRDWQGKHHKRWTLASMVGTDVFRRAGPWSAMIWEGSGLPKDLNFKASSRWSVAISGLAPMAALAAPFLPGAGKAAALGAAGALAFVYVLLNLGFLGFLRRKRGLLFAAASVPLLWLHHLCGGATLAVCMAWFTLTGRPRRPARGAAPAPAAVDAKV